MTVSWFNSEIVSVKVRIVNSTFLKVTWYECENPKDPRGPEYNEFTNAPLICDNGATIDMISAFYGRASKTTCSGGYAGNPGAYNL